MAERREVVVALLRELDRMGSTERSIAILTFLRGGLDIELPGQFIVGLGGWLKDWTSLRVALLDYLAQRDTASTALICREILEAPPRRDADEWALALRELARGETADHWSPIVARRMVDLVQNTSWADAPSRAYLEAFDILVAGQAVSLLPELDRLITNGATATRFAAFLSADRLILAAPVRALEELNRQPELFSTQPQCRAGLFARGDVRDPAQLAALEDYLRRLDISPKEQQMFAAAFPLYDLAISDNLLTPPARRSLADMRAHDVAVVRQMLAWEKNPAFARWATLWPAPLNRLRQQLGAAGITGIP